MIRYRLDDIKFPIWPIRHHKKMWVENGITYIMPVSPNEQRKPLVLDNKNLKGDTLGKRRLRVNGELYRLGKAILIPMGLFISPYKIFVDSEGKHFKYRKSEYCRLEYKAISKVIRSPTEDYIYVAEINKYFQISRNTDPPGYAGILKWNGGYMLYEFSKERFKTTFRKI